MRDDQDFEQHFVYLGCEDADQTIVHFGVVSYLYVQQGQRQGNFVQEPDSCDQDLLHVSEV